MSFKKNNLIPYSKLQVNSKKIISKEAFIYIYIYIYKEVIFKSYEKSYAKKKNMKPNIQLNQMLNVEILKHEFFYKKKQINLDDSPKPELIF